MTTTTKTSTPPSLLTSGDGVQITKQSSPFQHQASFIPALTPQCHASNLILLANGDILCAWFGGSQEGKPDISIYLSRLPAGSTTWEPARQMTFDATRSEQNPVLFEVSPNHLMLLYTSQDRGNQDTAIVKRISSLDNGETWSEPGNLFSDPGTFIRQPVIVLEDSTWVVPVFKCITEPGMRWLGNDDISYVRASKDQGQTWTEYEIPQSLGCVHMEIQRLKSGKYLGLFRSRWADNVYLSRSQDGLHWDPPTATELPNPNAGICFDVLSSGRVVMVYNHSSKANAVGRREGLYDEIAEEGDNRQNQISKHGKEAFWGAPRAPLCLAWSDDEGRSWQHRVLMDGDGFCMTNNSEEKLNRELSYPSMIVDGSGTMHVAFTYWRQRIRYMRFGSEVFS